MSPTNVLGIIVIVIAVVIIFALRKRGEQRGSELTPPLAPPTPAVSSAGVDIPGQTDGVHAHVHTVIQSSTNIVSRLPDEDRAPLDRWLGSSGGEWTQEQQLKFSAGFQRFLWDGEGLPLLLAGVSKLLRMQHPSITGTPLDVDVPPDVRAVFAKLVHGSITTRISS